MLTCMKCNGRIFHDTVHAGEFHIDVYCIRCGFRKIVSKNRNAFGRWLTEQVSSYQNGTTTS